jgi:hypothetical protein
MVCYCPGSTADPFTLISSGHCLLGVLFITSLKLNLPTAVGDRTGNNAVTLRAKHATAPQPNVFLTGIHWSLDINI